MILEFIFNIGAVSKQRPRFSTKDGVMRTMTAPATRQFERTIAILAKSQMRSKPLTGLLTAQVVFELEKPKKTKFETPNKDLDNLLKSLFDACNGIVYHDDTQIYQITALKRWSDKNQIRLLLSESE